MDQPQRTRLALAAAAAVGVAAVVFVLSTQGNKPKAPPQETAPPATGALPTPPPSLGRADVIALVRATAASFAAGKGYPAENRELPGRRIEVVIPFGCSGAGPSPYNPAQWTLNPKGDAVTFTVQPIDWTNAAWVREMLGPGEYDQISGFWLPRPWIVEDTCPAAAKPAVDVGAAAPVDPPAPGKTDPRSVAATVVQPPAIEMLAPPSIPTPPSIGLMRVFTAEASRVGQRRDRAYSLVRKARDFTPHPYQLVLGGRIAAADGGEPILCHGEGPDRPPTCLVSVSLDQVAIMDPGAQAPLAQWSE